MELAGVTDLIVLSIKLLTESKRLGLECRSIVQLFSKKCSNFLTKD